MEAAQVRDALSDHVVMGSRSHATPSPDVLTSGRCRARGTS